MRRLLLGVLMVGLALPVGAEPRLPPGAPDILSDFLSWRGVNGGRRDSRHQGIDIGGPDGQRIIAIADGLVLETDIGDCWGPTVVIDHGRDRTGRPLIAAYGHVARFAVRPGQRVRRGDVVARLGNNHRRYDCIGGVRHLHLQLGRAARGPEKGSYWGHLRYLKDGRDGVDPHPLWADGPGRVTCFQPGRSYPPGTLTYPLPCR